MTFEEKINKLAAMNIVNPAASSSVDEEKKKKCPICNGDMWIIDKDGFAKECKCRKEQILERTLAFANIPERYKTDTFDNYRTDIYAESEKMEAIKGLMQTYVTEYKKGSRGLYISSATKGSGKTKMAATIGNELLKKGFLVKFATSNAILEEIKKSWDRKSEYTESELIDGLIRADVLIIDDFGMEKSTDWINDKFYYIINSRYEKKRTTIYTSNYRVNDIDYNDRIVSRIIGTCHMIPWTEESIREKEGEYNKTILKQMMRRSI